MPGFIAKKLCPQVKAGRAVTQPSHSTHTHTVSASTLRSGLCPDSDSLSLASSTTPYV